MSYNCQDRRPVHKPKLNLTTASSELRDQFSPKSLGIFFSLFLMGTAIVSYYVVREIQLRAARQLIQNCAGQENCTGRIDALERLVKAKRSLQSSDLSQAQLSGANLSSAQLQDADLSGARLSNAQLNFTNLTHAKLSEAQLDRADLSSASLYFADLNYANLNYARLNYAQLNYAHLSHASLDSADLNYTDLSGANLDSADLYHASLDSADLNYTDLSRANLDSADLNLANFYHANLEQANLYHANLIEVHNLTPAQIKSACYWETAMYRGDFDNEKKIWLVDEKLNQQYLEQLKQDKASNPKHPLNCHS